MVEFRQLQKVQQKGGNQMNKLKERIDSRYNKRSEFAEALGVDKSTLSRMLKNGNWKYATVIKAADLLDIPDSEIRSYFFTDSVVNKQLSKV